RSHESAKALKSANDLTNELLEKNAEGLREANVEIRTQMERGVFDIESIKIANNTLIDTLTDSLRIADEGKQTRAKALIELDKTERELKEALLATKAKMESLPEESIADVTKG
ncbi:MAG TPA: toxic anion resistance protein, partial [Sulfurovum sp.]|nr:toxic anion resistance protein [Sulfurovum sp.]